MATYSLARIFVISFCGTAARPGRPERQASTGFVLADVEDGHAPAIEVSSALVLIVLVLPVVAGVVVNNGSNPAPTRESTK